MEYDNLDIAFRVSKAYDSSGIANVIGPIMVHASKAIIYYHDVSDNPHIHGYVEGYSKSAKWFRETLKKQFGVMKRTEYTCNFDASCNFITYMSKGKLDPIYNQGFNEEMVNELKAKGYDKGDITKSKKTVSEPNKPTKWTLLKDIEDKAAKCGCLQFANIYPKCVLKHIIRVLHENKQLIGEYKVKDYFDSIFMYHDGDNFIDRMVAKIFPEPKQNW